MAACEADVRASTSSQVPAQAAKATHTRNVVFVLLATDNKVPAVEGENGGGGGWGYHQFW